MTKPVEYKDVKEYPNALSVSEVAEILRICKKTVYKLIHKGEIHAVRIGSEFRVPKRPLHRYMNGN